MKGFYMVAVAAVVGAANANVHHHAGAHKLFEKRNATNEVCTTYVTTIYGEMTWKPTPAIVTTVLPTKSTTTKTTSITSTTTETPCTVPTLAINTCPTPGTYSFPATTVVVTETTTVCGASTTSVPSGTHTLGGVTTVVETATTIVCPVATTSTLPGGVVTSIIETTTYVCPSAGTYTIGPVTTVCETDTVVVVPVVTSFAPATYTRPAVVTTVTETDIVVYCPFDIPTATPSPAAPPAPTTTKAAPPKPTHSSGGTQLGGGDIWAMTYTPYDNSGACKAAESVTQDIINIARGGFTTVRVYSTDCDTLDNVGEACKSQNIKMIVGIFIDGSGCDLSTPKIASQISALKSWGEWNLVELVVVGNEAVNQGFCTPQELGELVKYVKGVTSKAGASVPVTTTDTVNVWQESQFSEVLCGVVDIAACNAHAYFNAQTTPDEAGNFVKGQLDIVKNICGKEAKVLETGWPSVCKANGMAKCSTEDQATAISSIKEVIGGDVVFFSYGDDDWKDNGACNCEKHWGCGHLF